MIDSTPQLWILWYERVPRKHNNNDACRCFENDVRMLMWFYFIPQGLQVVREPSPCKNFSIQTVLVSYYWCDFIQTVSSFGSQTIVSSILTVKR